MWNLPHPPRSKWKNNVVCHVHWKHMNIYIFAIAAIVWQINHHCSGRQFCQSTKNNYNFWSISTAVLWMCMHSEQQAYIRHKIYIYENDTKPNKIYNNTCQIPPCGVKLLLKKKKQTKTKWKTYIFKNEEKILNKNQKKNQQNHEDDMQFYYYCRVNSIPWQREYNW